jgi:hypothetical protein
MPVKRRVPKARCDALPATIERLLKDELIKYSPKARRELVNAIWFTHPPILPQEAETRALGLLQQWREGRS